MDNLNNNLKYIIEILKINVYYNCYLIENH